MKLKHHMSLTVERWGNFPFFRQILMIATEMNRAARWIKAGDFQEVKRCYERVLELLYLTVATLDDNSKLVELMRFKEMLCMLYAKDECDFLGNSSLMKTLLLLDKESYAALNPGEKARKIPEA